MPLTFQQVKAAFFNRLYQDGAGSTVRATFTVTWKEQIKKESLPMGLFLAFDWGPTAGGPRTGIRKAFPAWYACEPDSQADYRRLEPALPLLEAAYPVDAIPQCYIDFLPVRELRLPIWGDVPAKEFRCQVTWRG